MFLREMAADQEKEILSGSSGKLEYNLQTFPENCIWSGADDVPTLGARVNVKLNSMGHGTVDGYFTEHGWLGIYVNLDVIPSWRVRRRLGANVMVFGAEVERLRG